MPIVVLFLCAPFLTLSMTPTFPFPPYCSSFHTVIYASLGASLSLFEAGPGGILSIAAIKTNNESNT